MTAPLTKRTEAFSETAIDEEVVLLNLADGTFFSLIGTGAEIWRLIDGARDRVDLLQALAAMHGTDATAIEADVDGFLGELRAAGFLG